LRKHKKAFGFYFIEKRGECLLNAIKRARVQSKKLQLNEHPMFVAGSHGGQVLQHAPECCLILDLCDDVADGRLYSIKDASVAMFPDHPWS
jgi:hypothetical protein